ncbi:MAG TPA: polysaccharide deacetylase family protein [Candidatus Blautia excrementigallinarum]|nr:polysaccharide deacetylase family protein [Candidatus Blautia excrementigallinarum]
MFHPENKFPKRFSSLIRPRVLIILTGAFIAGSSAGLISHAVSASFPVSSPLNEASSWGLSFRREGARPEGNADINELKQYNAYYAEDTDEKVLYLTFDAGYENGNTPAILDALKKHGAPAAFFVVGNFIEDEPELVKRIVEEGHIVGNHTMTHPDMSAISTQQSFQEELAGVEKLFQDLTGEPMVKFYRPPRGVYSISNLAMADNLGYATFFWSLAYVDWDQEQQPSREEAFSKLLPRVHPGAIVLLHNTSSTNAEILDELLTKWEEMGYSFAPLTQLTGE